MRVNTAPTLEVFQKMEAFFLTIASLVALLVMATAVCVALRFGLTQRVAPSSGVGEEFTEFTEFTRPRRHVFVGPLMLSLALLFSVTLLLAVISR